MSEGSESEIVLSGPERAVSNASWTWFTGKRAVVDTEAGADGPRILVGGVTAADGSSGGDVVVLWYDVGDASTGHAVLHAKFEQDDHDGPALLVRPDGRYLAMYAKHDVEPYVYWRVSTEPHDPTTWRPEQRLDVGSEATYCNVYRLPRDAGGTGRTYCFTRATNWDPNVLVSTDFGSTWSHRGRLLTRDGGSARPYLRYWGDGVRIHCVAAEEHPHRHDNSVFHGYLQDGALYDSSGVAVSGAPCDADAAVPDVTDLTTVFGADWTLDGRRMTNAWPVDAATDATGRPVVLFQARVDGEPADHRFVYATHEEAGWTVRQISRAGGPLVATEHDYTGLAAIDPDETSRVFVSTPVDPRDGETLACHELFVGETSDGGETWGWRAVTPDSSKANLRPVVPQWSSDRTALVWLRGEYAAYTEWETQAVCRLRRYDGRSVR